MPDPESLKWRIYLAKREPKKALLVVIVSLVAGFGGAVFTGSFLMFIVGTLVVFLGTADFMLPVSFEVGVKGAKSRCGLSVTEISWEKVKRVIQGEDGIKLSPLEEPSRLSAFRGVYLRTDGNQQEILERISYWREKYASDVGKPTDGRGEIESD